MVLNTDVPSRGRRGKAWWVVLLVIAVAMAGTAVFITSGVYNVAADVPHTQPVYALLESLRERSIARRATALHVPDLEDPELIRQGSGNYDSMCMGCHLGPGMPETELSKGLYPAPPALAKTGIEDPAQAFWAIKHGIKATGMPAWGKSMDDEYIWGMVAFLQQLPKLDEQGYRSLVASSSGHSHGGATLEREHAETEDERHEAREAATSTDSKAAQPQSGTTHEHADGSTHLHSPRPKPKTTTDHQH